MPTVTIITASTPERETVTVDFRHCGDGEWEADVGDGYEAFASFDKQPSDGDDFQKRTVVQLLKKDYDVTYGGNPDDLKFE